MMKQLITTVGLETSGATLIGLYVRLFVHNTDYGEAVQVFIGAPRIIKPLNPAGVHFQTPTNGDSVPKRLAQRFAPVCALSRLANDRGLTFQCSL
jgi:hypothetical protein